MTYLHNIIYDLCTNKCEKYPVQSLIVKLVAYLHVYLIDYSNFFFKITKLLQFGLGFGPETCPHL